MTSNNSNNNDNKSAAVLFQILKQHKASHVLATINPTNKVIELDSTTSPIDAANTLWKHNILGAPVWDEELQKYIGFFDMRDILSAVVATRAQLAKEQEENDEEEEYGAAAAAAAGGDGQQFNIAMVHELKNLGGNAINVKYLSARNPMPSWCFDDSDLVEVCKMITDHRCHRMPICDATTSRVSNIISQSALVKFLSEQVKNDLMAEEVLSIPISESELEYQKPVVSIMDDKPAAEAFGILDAKRLSGIAVVDHETGAILGNTSARDIKLAAKAGNFTMDMDILSYLSEVRMMTVSVNDKYPSCHVHEYQTIAHVIHLLAKTGYHRVFVVDEDRKPIGVISVADIIRFALQKGSGEEKKE